MENSALDCRFYKEGEGAMESHYKYKKYILFQYNSFSPAGGRDDIEASFDTIEHANAYIRDHIADFNRLVDRDTWETVE